MITSKQQSQIDFLRNHLRSEGRYEVKYENIDDSYPRFVSFSCEVGLPNDEGTMASIFARDRIQIFIGRSGGLSTVNAEGKVVRGNWLKVYYTSLRMHQPATRRHSTGV